MGTKYQITTTGGRNPLWSPDGKQLFYLSGASVTQLNVVDVQTQPAFSFGKPMPLPIEIPNSSGPRPYDITPDGKHFVALRPQPSADAAKNSGSQINVALNWLQELKQRIPLK